MALIGAGLGHAETIGYMASNYEYMGESTYTVIGSGYNGSNSGHPYRSHNTQLRGNTYAKSNAAPWVAVYIWKRDA